MLPPPPLDLDTHAARRPAPELRQVEERQVADDDEVLVEVEPPPPPEPIAIPPPPLAVPLPPPPPPPPPPVAIAAPPHRRRHRIAVVGGGAAGAGIIIGVGIGVVVLIALLGRSSSPTPALPTEADEKRRTDEEDARWRDEPTTPSMSCTNRIGRSSEQEVLKFQEERERKHQEKWERKQASRASLEHETVSLGATATAAAAAAELSAELSQADVSAPHERRIIEQRQLDERRRLAAQKVVVADDETPIEENLNRLQIDGDQARNVDEAIRVLDDTSEEADAHPEKRMRAAYAKFEADNLPRLKAELPTLRMSQLRQLLKMDWQKSPDNPLFRRLLNR